MTRVDHIIDICKETGASALHFSIYQPVRESDLRPVGYMEWIELRRYASKRTEKEGIALPEGCIEGGCIGDANEKVYPSGKDPIWGLGLVFSKG